MKEEKGDFKRLVKIMEELRTQCPWDRKQSIHSLRPQTIEELYELTQAITEENWKGICEESGDLLLHIVFYAKIGAEKKKYTITDVIEGICEKLIARHPHIYGDVKVSGEEEVKKNWEKLKLKEGKRSVLEGVPQAMPALPKAVRIQEKAKQVGFEWEQTAAVWDKVTEEMEELKEAVVSGDKDAIEDEMGDLLFSIVNYARFVGVDPEQALERTNKKFTTRFQKMEKQVLQQEGSLSTLSLKEMDQLWNQVKQDERGADKKRV